MRTVTLRAGHAKPLWHGHPWVFARSVASIDEPDAEPDWVRVRDHDGRTIGHGLLSETSAIRVRLLGPGEPDGSLDGLLRARIERAAALRARLFPDPDLTNAYRLVHAEADGLPGLVVDRLGDVLVGQLGTRPLHARRETLARHLMETTGAAAFIARPGRKAGAEGLPVDEAFHVGDPVPDAVEIRELGTPFIADPKRGQKTGHYVDQRENRVLVAALAEGRDVLDLFAGSAGFSIQALRAGARSAVAVDSGRRAAEGARANAKLAGVAERLEIVRRDVGEVLAAFKASRKTFDVVVVDPPNLVPERGARRRALKTWRELIVRALTRVSEQGVLASFSCTPHVDADDLWELMLSASRDCRRPFRILRTLTAGPDHPVLPSAPTSRYLSGLLVEVRPW